MERRIHTIWKNEKKRRQHNISIVNDTDDLVRKDPAMARKRRKMHQEDGVAQEGARQPPKLLNVILGENRVKSLRELILGFSRDYPEAMELKNTLVHSFDHTDYVNLLDTTWCVVRQGAQPLKKGFSLQQYSNQIDVCPLLYLCI